MTSKAFLFAFSSVAVCIPFCTFAASPFYALDRSGDLYTVGATGNTSAVASGLSGYALAADASGDVFFNYNFTLRERSVGGTVNTYSTTANAGLIHGVQSLVFDAAGNLYDSNPADGTIGITPKGGGSTTQFAAGLVYPYYLAINPAGTLYATSSNNDLIYQITASGSVSSFTPTLGAPGIGGDAFDSSGNFYYVTNNDEVVKILPGGTESVFSTDPGYAFGALGVDNAGDVFATTQYDTIVEMTPSGGLSTFATFPNAITSFVLPVPEPASGAIFLMMGVASLRRSRRKR